MTHSLDKAVVDGAFCGTVQRRLSQAVSSRIAPHVTGNAVTAIDFVVGLLAAGCLAVGWDLLGVVLVQIFGILSCVDGEVARLRGQTSRRGDFFDTMVDRSIEFVVILAVTHRLAFTTDPASAYMTGLLLLGGVFLIATSAAKFRSTFDMAYPKRLLEPGFSWISAGSDARLAMISCGICLEIALGTPVALLSTLQILCFCTYVNLLVRMFLILAHITVNGEIDL